MIDFPFLRHTRNVKDSLWSSLADALQFSDADIGWKETVEQYVRYSLLRQKNIPYRKEWGLFDTLGEREAVGIVGDWGTGTQRAEVVLQQMADKGITAFLHLGDIYYSGTPAEVQHRFIEPCRRILPPSVRVFSLPGNHDMYCAGHGYYGDAKSPGLVDQIGQNSSHFRWWNKYWQLIGVDTAFYDYNPLEVSSEWTGIQTQEALDIQNWTGALCGERKTILLSHHPLFTAFEPIKGEFVNGRLVGSLNGATISNLAAWFWGHEHRTALYEPAYGLKRGRCLGAGAIPVLMHEELSRVNESLFVKFQKRPEANDGLLMDQGYGILQLSGPTASVSYYTTSDPKTPFYVEVL